MAKRPQVRYAAPQNLSSNWSIALKVDRMAKRKELSGIKFHFKLKAALISMSMVKFRISKTSNDIDLALKLFIVVFMT